MARARRQVRVVVNGREYRVEVGDLTTSPLEVVVDGRSYQVEVGEPAAARADAPAPASDPTPAVRPQTAPAAGGARQVRAPMPGNILDVKVSPGETVTHGQMLCALEAMKMKSAIRAPWAGVVRSVEVAAGQPVAHGDVLFTFE